jgi:hypothetical protein
MTRSFQSLAIVSKVNESMKTSFLINIKMANLHSGRFGHLQKPNLLLGLLSK